MSPFGILSCNGQLSLISKLSTRLNKAGPVISVNKNKNRSSVLRWEFDYQEIDASFFTTNKKNCFYLIFAPLACLFVIQDLHYKGSTMFTLRPLGFIFIIPKYHCCFAMVRAILFPFRRCVLTTCW